MPDIGYTSVGASTESVEAIMIGGIATPGSSGTSDSVTAYLRETASDGAHSWQGGVYVTSSGALVGNSSSVTNATTTAAWRTVTLSGLTITSGTGYVITVFAGSGSGGIDMYYDSTGGPTNARTKTSGITFPTWPDPITWTATPTRNYSVYLTYTEAAAGQPYVKRTGGIPFMSRNRGVW